MQNCFSVPHSYKTSSYKKYNAKTTAQQQQLSLLPPPYVLRSVCTADANARLGVLKLLEQHQAKTVTLNQILLSTGKHTAFERNAGQIWNLRQRQLLGSCN